MSVVGVTSSMEKKREVLPFLNKAIIALSELSGAAATLEISDNDRLSRELKQRIVDFKTGPLNDLTNCVFDVRKQIKENKKIRKSNKLITKKTES